MNVHKLWLKNRCWSDNMLHVKLNTTFLKIIDTDTDKIVSAVKWEIYKIDA